RNTRRTCRPSFALKRRRPRSSTLFPYTTLFRSIRIRVGIEPLLRRRSGIGRERHAVLDANQTDSPAARVRRSDDPLLARQHDEIDRKSTRLNSSHVKISYAVFCLKKKKISLNHG